jgi:hypothetical protein
MPTVGRLLARWRRIGESRQQHRAGVADAQHGDALEPPGMGLSVQISPAEIRKANLSQVDFFYFVVMSYLGTFASGRP